MPVNGGGKKRKIKDGMNGPERAEAKVFAIRERYKKNL
jgi:hypothetical protein